jgi:hypothetical protein
VEKEMEEERLGTKGGTAGYDGWHGVGVIQAGGGGRATPCYLSIITLQDLDLSLQPVVSF